MIIGQLKNWKVQCKYSRFKKLSSERWQRNFSSCCLKKSCKSWVRNGMDTGKLKITPTLDKKVVTNDQVAAPVNKGMKVGTATIT